MCTQKMATRDKIYPVLAHEGYTHIEDPKVRLDRFEKVMPWLEARGIPVFGHLSVGIFHPCFNVNQEKLVPVVRFDCRRLSERRRGLSARRLLRCLRIPSPVDHDKTGWSSPGF